MQNTYVKRFVMTVILPLMMAVLAVSWLTLDLVNRVSDGANEADHQRTAEIVTSALHALQVQLANTAADNATWDDAVRNTYTALNPDWLSQTWGELSATGINYHTILIVDRALPIAVAGFENGEPFEPNIADYFKDKLNLILDRLPKDNSTPSSGYSIIETTKGLALVAAASIVPTSTELTVPQTVPRYLVLVKFLRPEFIRQVGEQYVVKDLRMVDNNQYKDATAISGGVSLGGQTFIWNDKRPGDTAGKHVLQNSVFVLGFLGFVLAAICALYWQLLRKIANNENLAKVAALQDTLTNLPNRSALFAAIEIQSSGKSGNLSLAFLDLDGFKHVNDTYDHEIGDRLIKAVGAGFASLVENKGTLFRLGGDEFVMLFCGEQAVQKACKTSELAIQFLAKPFDIDGRIVTVGVSIGISSTAKRPVQASELLRRADIAMYHAKANGKNRHCMFSDQFDTDREIDTQIASELSEILAQGTLGVAYQPIVDAQSRKIVGVEALARWPLHSDRRVSPDKFVAVAEQHGLIDALGEAVLAKACIEIAPLPGIRLATNISPMQLSSPLFTANTLRIIRESGMDTKRVELEITEGRMVNDFDTAKTMFKSLKAEGIRIALDDFGSGYSSLGYLSEFEFNTIKIDRSVVDCIMQGPESIKIVQGAVLIAAGHADLVIAEGVEHAEQIDLLRLSGCREMQGYYFSKPVSIHELNALVLHNKSETIQLSA